MFWIAFGLFCRPIYFSTSGTPNYLGSLTAFDGSGMCQFSYMHATLCFYDFNGRHVEMSKMSKCGNRAVSLCEPNMRFALASFLGLLIKWRKATSSSAICVCPHGTTRLPFDGFS